jgi:hypothetical protein
MMAAELFTGLEPRTTTPSISDNIPGIEETY